MRTKPHVSDTSKTQRVIEVRSGNVKMVVVVVNGKIDQTTLLVEHEIGKVKIWKDYRIDGADALENLNAVIQEVITVLGKVQA